MPLDRSRAPGCWSAACRRRSIVPTSAVDMGSQVGEPLAVQAREWVLHRVDRLAEKPQTVSDPPARAAARMHAARPDHLPPSGPAPGLAARLAPPNELGG